MTLWRAVAVALGTAVLVLLWPGAAFAGDCGPEVSYQVDGGTAPDCGGASSFVAAATIGGVVLALAVAAAAASYAAGGVGKPELDALIDAQTTTSDTAAATSDPAAASSATTAASNVTGTPRTTGDTTQAGGPTTAGGEAYPQRALEASPATRSLSQVRNTRNRQLRAARAEQWSREVYRGGGERHYPVTTINHPVFPVTRPGGRKVDVPVDMPDGTITAVEIKMWSRFRTVTLADGSKQTRYFEVPLKDEIREQINKDIALRNENPWYQPLWSFLYARPSPELRNFLIQAGITFNEINWRGIP